MASYLGVNTLFNNKSFFLGASFIVLAANAAAGQSSSPARSANARPTSPSCFSPNSKVSRPESLLSSLLVPQQIERRNSQRLSSANLAEGCEPPPPPADPAFSVFYNAFIPQDHVSGPAPTTCSPTTGYIYLGDRQEDPMTGGSPYSYRVAQGITLLPNSGTFQNGYSNTGYTNQFYRPSPFNTYYITNADYDGISGDCYKWTGQAQAQFGQNGNSATFTTTPGTNNIVTNIVGQATDPLQVPSIGAIRWNVSVTINKTTGASSHAFVSGAVSCYPSHQIIVNSLTVGYYDAPKDPGINYIINCLVFNGPSTPLQGPGTSPSGVSVSDY